MQTYFDSISRLITLTERVPTGKTDRYGHEITKSVEVKNAMGKPIVTRVFYVPPERYGLTAALGISIDTWERYAVDPKLADAVAWAEETMEGWKTRELINRESKRTAGLIYEMERNHRRRKSESDADGRATPMVDLADAQLIAMAAQLQEE